MLHFDTLKILPVENIVRKVKIACNFIFILNVLYNVVCKLFQFGSV